MRAGLTFRFREKAEPYIAAMRSVGIEVIPLQAPGPHTIDGLDGLIIGGGTDLNPDLYGQDPHPENEDPDDERDAMELWLVNDALQRDVPLLCICRGMQLLNVALGGELHQHLDQAVRHRRRGVTDVHPVRVLQGTRLAEALGAAEFTVNSRHHQALSKLGSGLRIAVRSDDGIIEGVELPDRRFAVGVQWHPEDRVPSHAPDTRLFEAFMKAAG